MSKFKGKKTNNAKNLSKIKIREKAFFFIENARVLDVFCGNGEMFNAVYHKADFYTGIDINNSDHHKNILVGDYIDCLKQIDIDGFDLIDIDAYGSPYKALDYIVKKTNWSNVLRKTFVITDGIDIDLRMGNIEQGLSNLTNVKIEHLKGAHKLHDNLIMKMLKNIEILTRLTVCNTAFTKGLTGSGMRYYTFSLVNDVV